MGNAAIRWLAGGVGALLVLGLVAFVLARESALNPVPARTTDPEARPAPTGDASGPAPLASAPAPTGTRALEAAAGPSKVVVAPARLVSAAEAAKTDKRPAGEIPSAAGAVHVRELAARLPEAGDIVRLGRTFAADPEMVQQLTPLLAEWAASPDADLRRRAALFSAGLLGSRDAAAWTEAVDRAADPEVRIALLAAAPVTGEVEHDRPYIARLVTVATADGDAQARTAAIRGLPPALDADALGRLAAAVPRERATAVRAEMVRLLGHQRSDDARVVKLLRDVGFDAAEDRAVRRDALAGVIRSANAHADLLKPEDMEQIEKTLGTLDR